MAKYRQIQVSFWQDSFVLSLTPEEKYFYLYLMTNPKASACGIYELPLRVMEFETGYNAETILKLLQKFIAHEKVQYNQATNELFLTNWIKHNEPKSPATRTCVVSELKDIKHTPFVLTYLTKCSESGYPLEGAYRGPVVVISDKIGPPGEKEKEQEKEKDKETHPRVPDGTPLPASETQNCPQQEIIALYHKTLPMLPSIKIWSPDREKSLRQRWREDPKRQSLDWWEKYFTYIRDDCPFLLGQGGGERHFLASLEWLLKPKNFCKVIEGHYGRRDGKS